MSKRKPQFDGYAFLNSPEISAYLDQQEAEQAKAARQRPAAVTSAPANPSPAEPEDRTWGEAVHDTRSAISQGVGGLVGGAAWLGNQVGIGDGETAREMAGFSQYLEEEKSAKARSANRAVEKADGAAATLSALIDNPIAVADMVAKSAPLAVPGMGAAGLASRGAAALGKGLVARQMAATVAGVGAESLTSGSMAGNELYQGVTSAGMEQLRRHSSRFRELEAETGSAEQAREQLALEVSRAGALLAGAGTAAGGAIAGKVAGRLGLESGYASAVGKNVLTPAGLAKNMGREAMEEAIQSPLEDVGQGVARREADERVNPFDNIGKSALLGAVGAIGQTGATSAVQGLRNGVALREPGQVDSVAPGAPQELAPTPAATGAFDPIAPSQADLLRRAGIEPDPVAEAATASVESIFGAGDPTAGLVASVMRGDALQPIHDLAAVRANTVLPAQSAEGGLFEPQWLPDAATGESAAALPLPKHGFDSQEQLLANARLDARDALQRAEIAGQIEAAYAGREPAALQKARELEALAQESALPVAIERAEQANQLAGALDRAAGVDVPQPTAMQLALQAAQRNTMQANASIGNATQQQTEPVDTGQAPNVSASAPDVLAAAPNISEPAPNISRDDAPRLAHDDQADTDAPALTMQQTERGQWLIKGDMAQHAKAIREALPGTKLVVSQQNGQALVQMPADKNTAKQGKQIRKALDHLLLSGEKLAQRDAQRMAAGERAKAQNQQARQIDHGSDDILQAVAKLGGIDTEQALSEWWRGQRETIGHYNGEVPGNLRRQGVFAFKRQGGLPIDDMIRRLEGEGYLPQGSTPNDLLDAIEQRRLHPAGMERQAQEAFEARQQEEAPGEFQQAYHDGEFADDFTQRELEDNTDYFDLGRQQREAIEAAAQAADDQFWRDIYDGKNAITPTEEQLDDIFGPEKTSGQGQVEAAAVKNDAGRATAGAQGVQPDGEAEGAQDGFGLTSYTAGDLQRQAQEAEQRRVEDERQRAAADKARQEEETRKEIRRRSEAAADTFVLGGNAEDNLTGQGGLFDAPVKANNPDQKMIAKSDGAGFATRDALRAAATRDGIPQSSLIEKRDEAGNWIGLRHEPDNVIDRIITDESRAGKVIGTSIRDLHSDDVYTLLMAASSKKQINAIADYIGKYAPRAAADAVKSHIDSALKQKGWATEESLYGGGLFDAPTQEPAKPSRITEESVGNMRAGDVVRDGKGDKYLALGARHKWLEVAPIVNGKAQISADTTFKFHLDPETAGAYPERRSDPVYATGDNLNERTDSETESSSAQNTADSTENTVEAPQNASSDVETSAAIDALIAEGERRRDAGEPPRKRGDSLAYAPPPGDGDYDSPRNWLTENELARLHELQQSLPSAGEERDAAKARIQEKLARRRGGLFSISGRGAGKSGGVFAPDAYDAHQFALAVDRVAGAATAPRTDLGMGDTPTVLRALGANPLPIQMSSSLIHKASRTEVRGHDVPVDVLRNLPSLLADPVMVFDSSTEQGALVVLVDAQDASGRAVVVAVHLNARGGGFHRINKIASVYGKDDVADIERWMRGGLRYYQTKKAAQWLHAVGLQLPEANTIKRLNPRVITNAEIVNARHSFAGQRAKTADQHALGTAQQRIVAGEDVETVRRETGWFKGADGKWRFEIDDSGASLKRDSRDAERYADIFDEAASRAVPLANVLDHPALFAAYPQLKSFKVTIDPSLEEWGNYSDATRTITVKDPYSYPDGYDGLKSVLLHEIQHAIQSKEGFALGAAASYFDNKIASANDDVKLWYAVKLIKSEMSRGLSGKKALASVIDAGINADEDHLDAAKSLRAEDIERYLNDAHAYVRKLGSSYDMYWKVGGEVEARNVQARADMTDEQRKATPPSQTADVADQDVILVFNGKEMAHAPAIANTDTTQPQPTGMHPAELEALLRKVLPAHLQGRVKVVRTAADLPRGGQRAQDDGGTDGLYLPETGELYLVADAFDSPERALFVLEHELTHYGLRSRYHGFGELTEILEEARSHPVIDRLANAIAADRGMTVDSVRQDLADSWGVPVARVSRGLAKSRLTQETTEEALAELNAAIARDDAAYLKARYGVAVPRTLKAGIRARIARFVQRMKAWLAKATGKQADEYSDLDVWDLLAGVRDVVRGGENVAKEGRDSGENVADFPRSEADVSATARREMAEVRQRYAGTEQWLKAPNGEPTRLNEHQWLQVRTPSFKAWFGDWERAQHKAFLTGSPVSELTGMEFQKSDAPLTKRVAEFFDSVGGKAHHPVIGDVLLTERGAKDSISHGLGAKKAAVFAAVPDVIEGGQVIDVEKNWKGRGYDGYTIAAPISIAGVHHVAVVIVHRDGNSNRFYLQEVALTDSLRDESAFKTGASAASQSAVEPSGADRRGALKTLLSDVFSVNDASKVVDENGEPLVVYHGTAYNFSGFDAGRHRSALNDKYQGDGFHFSADPAVASRYADANRNRLLRKRDIYPLVEQRFPGRIFKLFKDVVEHGYAKAWDMPQDEVSAVIRAGDDAGIDLNDLLDLAEVVEGSRYHAGRNNGNDPSEVFAAMFGGSSGDLLSGYHVDAMVRLGLDAAAPGQNVMAVYLKSDNPLVTDSRKDASAAQNNGHDGILYGGPDLVDDVPEWVVFSPEQIKSAIGNRGTFNGSDPNILRSTRPNKPAAAGFSLPEETRAQAAQRKGQDNMNRWKQVLGEIQRQGGAVDERNDVYGAEERFHGRTATQIEDFARLEVEPLMRRLADSGHDLKAVEEFLLAQHAEEANAAIREIDPGRDTAYGIEDAEAQALLARYQAMPDFARFEALANDFRRIADGTLELYLRAGIISQDAAAAMRATYQFYVPVKGGDEDQAARQGMGKGLSVNGKQKRRMGHDRREENVLENLLRDRQRAIILAEKNNVGTYLLDLVQRNPDPKLWTVGVLPKQKVLRDRVAYVVQHNGQPAETFTDVAAAEQFIDREVLRGAGQAKDFNILKTRDPYVTAMAKPMLQENEVQVYVQGRPLRIQLHDPVLVGQYRRMGTEMMGTLVETGKALNRWLSKVYTGYNPEFFVKNVVRDLTAGTINLTADQGAKVTAKALARWPKAGAAMFRYALTGEAPNGEYGRALKRYRAAGGSTGAAYMGDLERQADTLNTLYENYTGAWAAVKDGKPVKAARIATRKLVGGLAHWFEMWNQAGENAFRLATFMAMEESGKSVAQAASMAKNVTVNFNRNGELTPQLGAAYLFLNPNVQGTARLWQSLFGKDTPHKAQAWAMVGSMVGLALALAAMNRADDDDEWEATPDSVKDRNLLVPLGNGRKLTIPLPYGYSFFVSMANRLDAVMHGESAEKAGIRLASALFENFSPVGNPIGDNPDSKNLINMMPTAAKIVLQPAANITDFGGPMRPEYDQNQPDNEKMWRGTRGGVYDQAAQFVSDRVGSKYENDWADISPETLKYLVRTFTGGTGAFMADSASLLNVLAAGAEPDLAEVPFARSGARDMTVKDLRARFNELGGEARQHVDAWKRAVKAGDDAEAARYEQDYALMAMGELMDGYAKQARTVRDLMAAELRRDDLSLAAKRALQRRHEADEAAVYQEFIREFRH